MATSDGIAGAPGRERAWTSGLIAAATVVGILVVASIAYVVTGNQSADGVSVALPPREVTGTELIQNLVNEA